MYNYYLGTYEYMQRRMWRNYRSAGSGHMQVDHQSESNVTDYWMGDRGKHSHIYFASK